MDETRGFRLVRRPDEDELDRIEAGKRKSYGLCYDCKNHLAIAAMCMKTGMRLVYPISGCCGHDPKWSTGVP